MENSAIYYADLLHIPGAPGLRADGLLLNPGGPMAVPSHEETGGHTQAVCGGVGRMGWESCGRSRKVEWEEEAEADRMVVSRGRVHRGLAGRPLPVELP